METRSETTMRFPQEGRGSQSHPGCTLTRRDLLKRAGWLAAATAFRPWRAFAAEPISPVMARLSAYMSEARGRALVDEVVEKTKHHILDTIAAMVSGSQLPPGTAAIQFARDNDAASSANETQGSRFVGTVVCSRVLCNPIEAAFANGVLAHADETDDSHAASLSHPG